MKNVGFFMRQALSNMNRNRQRTLFVLFCIAVGVAAIVSLRTLGFMIDDALTGNAQAQNKGDLYITAVNPVLALGGEEKVDPTLIEERSFGAQPIFSDKGINEITAWADERGYETTLAIRQQGQGRIRPVSDDGAASTAIIYGVERGEYPFYGEIELVAPAGRSFADALAGDNATVITERLAEELNLELGDEILLTGSEPFVVTGIVPDSSEGSLTDANSIILPYVYLDYPVAAELLAAKADAIYIQFKDDADPVRIEEAFEERFEGMNVINPDESLDLSESVSETVAKVITTMGLISLLIGGIGIANTMVVVVGRRTVEIGVLKTIGLQGNQITVMFMIEALFMGVFGSLLGIGLGLILVRFLQGVAESVFAQSLSFAIYPQALIFGLVTGVIVTLVFGFLPTLSAGRVRPNVVLSPTDAAPPRAGIVATIISVILMTSVMGILVGIILESLLFGMAAAFGTVIALGVALLLFWLLVIIISRLPSFGNIYIKLAQRAMGTHAVRTASTLMALVIGMFSLSVILLMTTTLINVIEEVSAQQLGGNVFVVSSSNDAETQIDERLAAAEGINAIQKDIIFTSEIVAINGNEDVDGLIEAAAAIGRAELGLPDPGDSQAESPAAGIFGDFDLALFQLNLFLDSASVKTPSGVTEAYTISEGIDVTEAEANSMVLLPSDATEWLGLGLGDTITFRFRNDEEVTVSIVGFMETDVAEGGNVTFNTGAPLSIILSETSIPESVVSDPPIYILDIEDERINEVVTELSNIGGVFAVDVSQINEIFDQLLSQFTALPLIIAVLALFASGIIIANTVSLATLERRREIGIMKAIGLQGSSVLGLLQLENAIVGLLGGIIGTGIGAAIIAITGIVSDSLSSFPIGMLLLLILLSVTIAVIATLVSAVGAAREKPLIVLRYE